MVAYRCSQCGIHFTRLVKGESESCPACGSQFLQDVHRDTIHKYSLPVYDYRQRAAGEHLME